MNNLRLALINLRTHPLQSAISAFVVALAIGLSVAVLALADGVQTGITTAADPFGVLVIGPNGSPQQLVLNTLLLQDNPLGLIDYAIYEELIADPGAQLVIPLAFGDNIGGAPIIGTDLTFFQLRTRPTAPLAFQIAAGRLFTIPEHENEDEDHAEGDEHETFEIVLGNRAATDTGLQIGDRFQPTHGSTTSPLAQDVHGELIYEVVGILRPSNTPYDAAAFAPIQAIWHAHDQTGDEGQAGVALIAAEVAASENRLTAILVQPTLLNDAYRIWQQFYTRADAQAAFPGQELGQLFDLLSQASQVLNGIAYLVLAVAGLTVFLAIYNATLARQQSIAILRSLGGARLDIFQIVLYETLIITLLGALLGRLLGYGAAWLIANQITAQSAIPIPIAYLTNLEPTLWLLTVVVAILAGLIPALMAYRVNVVENLFPT